MKSRALASSACSSACFRGSEVLSARWTRIEEDGNIKGHEGVVSLWSEKGETVLSSRALGFAAIAVLGGGAVAVAQSNYTIAVLSPSGELVRELDTELGAAADWLAVGGHPERLFAATTSSGSKKSDTVVEIDPATWQKRHVALRSNLLPGISEHGICRVTKDGRIAEYAWKGAPKPMTPPVVGRGFWRTVRVRDGWFLNAPWNQSVFVDLSGAERWNRSILASFPGGSADDYVHSACAAGDNRLVLVTRTAILLVDAPGGALLASCPRTVQLAKGHREGGVVWDGGTRLAVYSDAGIELVEDVPGPAAQRAAPLGGVAAANAPATGAAGKPAQGASKKKATGSPAAEPPGKAAVDELTRLVDELSASDDPEKLAAANQKIGALALLEAGDDPACAKRIAAAVRKVRALSKATKLPAARTQLENILDTITSS